MEQSNICSFFFAIITVVIIERQKGVIMGKNFILEAGKTREGTFKKKGKEIFKISIEAIEDVEMKDLIDFVDLIRNPEQIEFVDD